jgi:TM2 domain-containing membrane protein YozV
MEKIRKAFWFSIFLTGAGQFYLGEKRKGWLFLIFSLLGALLSSVGMVFVLCIFLGLIAPILTRYKIFFPLGVSLSVIGLILIIVSGFRSIKDISSRSKD